MGICQRAIESLSIPHESDDAMRPETAVGHSEGLSLSESWSTTKRRVACRLKTQVLGVLLALLEGLESNIIHHIIANFNPDVLVRQVLEVFSPI